MYRSIYLKTIQQTSWKTAVGLTLLAGLCSGANADYQQAQAARGQEAFTTPDVNVSIEPIEIEEAFLQDAEQANQAVSDRDVMIELRNRIKASDQLAEAEANLAPTQELPGQTLSAL